MWWRAGLHRQVVSGDNTSRHPGNLGVTPGSEVNDLVDAGRGKMIFRTCLVLAHVIDTHPPFPVLLWYKTWIGYPVRVLYLFN
jgi:hypothetical protein